MFDLEPAAAQVETIVAGVTDDQMTRPSPCTEMTVRDLLVHFLQLTEAFRQAATKESVGRSAPRADTADLPLVDDWRKQIPAQLEALVAAWRDPTAWDGETEAGGHTLPAPFMASITLDELVVHGWDLARATGQSYDCDPVSLEVLLGFLSQFDPAGTPGQFGPAVPVPPDAPALDRVIGLTGRDPAWVSP